MFVDLEKFKEEEARREKRANRIQRRGEALYRKLAREIEDRYDERFFVAINTKTGEYFAQLGSDPPVSFVALEKWGDKASVWIQRVEGKRYGRR